MQPPTDDAVGTRPSLVSTGPALTGVPRKVMFLVMRNMLFSETELTDTVVALIRDRVPDSWSISQRRDVSRAGRRVDAELEIRAGRGPAATLLVEVKLATTPKQIPDAIQQLRSYGPADGYLLIAPYLSAQARERLRDQAISYADATGNVRIAVDRPALFIELQGADKNPWADDRPVKSLRGPAAAAVVRALCDFRPPYGVRELAERAGLSLASTSRTVSFLDSEALVERPPRGGIESVDWPRLLRRWTQDYRFMASNRTRLVLEPRGVRALLDKVRGDTRYAVTGSLAASIIAPVAPPALGALYVRELGAAQRDLQLRDAPTGANVMLVESFSPVAFERTWEREGIRYAALAQVAADLLTSPGRSPSEGEALIDWMKANENAWRT